MNMNEDITTIDLLRHGEPQGGRKYRGSLDDPLSEQGWVQMNATLGEHCPWQTIISSPLVRCSAFAQQLAQRHGLPLEIEKGLQEIHFGAWEGLRPNEIDPTALTQFWNDPLNHTPPEAETLRDFAHRVEVAWNTVLRNYSGQQLLIVAHGGTIRALLSHVLGMPLTHTWRLDVPYAAISRVCIYGRGASAQPLLIFHVGQLG